VIADCQGLKRGDCYLGNGADIGVRFTPDVYLVFHVPEFLFFIGYSAEAVTRFHYVPTGKLLQCRQKNDELNLVQ
jgi:hypothetical protein